jgi:methionyl-tRNA synthetase
LENGVCPEHKKKPEIVEEENYFFRLSVYQDQILKLIKNDTVKIIPEGRKNEILSFVKSGLEDICVSRSKERAKGWGIEVPGDENQVMWVWFDALSNYISALGYGGPENELFQEWWQNSQKIHMVGKGIIRFHAVHWIGLLLSAGLPVPNEIFVHGYVTSSGQKMSKSLGNVVDPFDLVAKYGTDPVRYFLLRELASTEDGDFTVARLEERYNADLAKGLGNLAARVTTIAKKINATANKDCANAELKQEIGNAISGRGEALGQYRFNDALAAIWKLVNHCDRYIEQTQPWKTNDAAAVGDLLFALSVIADLIEPFIPATSQKIKALLSGQEVGILFPRFDK